MKKLKVIFVCTIFATILNSADTIVSPSVFDKNINQQENIINKDQLFKVESSTVLKNILKSKKLPSTISRRLTKKYYKNHKYIPFWVDANGIKPIANDILDAIKEDQVLKSFSQKLFKLNNIDLLISDIENSNQDVKSLIKLDIMITSAYHQYMKYLANGIINWKKFQTKLKKLDEDKEIIANWRKYSVKKSVRILLYKAIENNDINIAINEVNYTFPKSKELSNLIKEFEVLAHNGGYTKVPKIKKSLKKGNYYKSTKQLRKRLYQSKDLEQENCLIEKEVEINTSSNLFIEQVQLSTKIDFEEDIKKVTEKKIEVPKIDCNDLYDEKVYQAVKSFQKRHGLVADGIAGRNTIARLNIPIEKKIKQMRINLERMRWMPRSLGEKYLIVNIPDYKLKMYNEGKLKLDMAVVVGTFNHPTPIFSHKISAIVLNPYWRIPQRIVKREIIPKLVNDPLYLSDRDIRVHENWSHKSEIVDTSEIDWNLYVDSDLIGNSTVAPMRFIQIPSNKNPLGRIKFMFPNKYSVYLHDTPFKRLFKYRKRAYSHGCIRLERPEDLLKTIAQEDRKVDYTIAKEILADIEKTDMDLSKKIPVHIVYLTSWIDDNGKIQFRDDVYRYDRMQTRLIYGKSL